MSSTHLELNAKLLDLRAEHRELDEQILEMQTQQPYCNQIELRRLKRRKLLAKDQMEQIESMQIPDLDA